MPHVHKYEQIVNDLRAQIISGQLAPGDRLPSMRQLRERYKVTDTPVRNALLILRTEGWTETRHGAGVYVKAAPAATPPA